MFPLKMWFLIFFGHEEKCFCTYFCQKMCVETQFVFAVFDNILILGSNLGWFEISQNMFSEWKFKKTNSVHCCNVLICLLLATDCKS